MSIPVETGSSRAYQYFRGLLDNWQSRCFFRVKGGDLGVFVKSFDDSSVAVVVTYSGIGSNYLANLSSDGSILWRGVRTDKMFGFKAGSNKARMAGDLLIRCAEKYTA
ncbi:MAG: hypothetical protein M1142_04585 [Patescibacteria group bacterium]|nr:hypothetical protein [Patescibacteria group bacterium]